jgi:hypothetical protein
MAKKKVKTPKLSTFEFNPSTTPVPVEKVPVKRKPTIEDLLASSVFLLQEEKERNALCLHIVEVIFSITSVSISSLDEHKEMISDIQELTGNLLQELHYKDFN